MSAFDDYFAKMTPGVEEWAAQFAAEPVTGCPVVMPAVEEAVYRDRLSERAAEIAGKITRGEIGPGLPPGYRFEFTRAKEPHPLDAAFAAQVRGTAPEPPPDGFMVPPGFAEDLRNAVMDAYGLPRDLFTRSLPPPAWRTRLRGRWSELREQTARRAFKVIAGYDVPEQED